MPPSKSKKRTIRESLEILGIQDASVFESCGNERGDEFKVVRKIYLEQVLKAHPDKGGDTAVFREIQTSFELLRDLHKGKRSGAWLFSECLVVEERGGAAPSKAQEDAYNMNDYDAGFDNMETPSWDYYAEAAAAEVPGYRVEIARSGRSRCKQQGKTSKKCSELPPDVNPEKCDEVAKIKVPEFIGRGEIRVGSMVEETGTYSRWHHLRCWRVPHKVWLGMPDPENTKDEKLFAAALTRMNDVLLSGFVELDAEDQTRFVRHLMDKSNWARATTKRKPRAGGEEGGGKPASLGPQDEDDEEKKLVARRNDDQKATALVKAQKQAFVVPVPGRNGCLANVLQGKRVVLTGIFPELGGGAGLSLGKDRAKALVASFGGRVTGSVSGKTDVLLVGKEPGYSKVSQARSRRIQLISLHDLKRNLESGAASLDDFHEEKPMLVQNFSAGYRANGLALKAAPEQMRVAQGLAPKRPLGEEPDSKPPARKKIRNQRDGERQDAGVLALEAPPRPANKENKVPDVIKVDEAAKDARPSPPKKTTSKSKAGAGQGDKDVTTLKTVSHLDAENKALVPIGNEVVVFDPSAGTALRRSTRIRKTRQVTG